MTSTTADQAYREIRLMLLQGRLSNGQRVSQSRLARQIGCSTNPVVEAMRRLESEGLLVKQPRKMARVRQLSAEDLEGLYLLREGLEGVTARLCANRITDEESRELEALSQEFENIWEHGYQLDKESEADLAIHRCIARCAHSPFLSNELDRLMLLKRTIGRELYLGPGDPLDHRALVQALIDHDADSAEYLMKKHIQKGYQTAMAELASANNKRLVSNGR